MKKTLLILMVASMIAITARGQVLQNTWWRSYWYTNGASYLWHFGQDTLFFNSDVYSNFPKATYTNNSNLFTIAYLDTTFCSFSDTGNYSFTILGDTLRFGIVSEPCYWRGFYFTYNYFVRIYVGISDINPISTATISPNPSADGIFNLMFTGNGNLPQKIYVMSADGRKIMDETFSSAAPNHTINLQSCAAGIYFLVLENEKGRRVAKLVR